MGVRKIDEQSVRTITQNSTGTYSVSLPISLVRKLSWRQGQKVVVTRRGKDLVIKDWEK